MELKYIEDMYDKSVQIPIRFVKENVANNLLTLPPFTSCNRPKHTDRIRVTNSFIKLNFIKTKVLPQFFFYQCSNGWDRRVCDPCEGRQPTASAEGGRGRGGSRVNSSRS